MQLELFNPTTENTGSPPVADRPDASDRSGANRHKAFTGLKATRIAGSARMEDVVKRLDAALAKVAANRGAPGPDRQTVAHVRACWPSLKEDLSQKLLAGTYRPGEIRRVFIPKGEGGGQRGLGIPNVIDRVVQDAVRQVLEPLYEPTFHPSSHGFRPNRGCQTAIAEARQYVAEGRHIVVDIDLETFFDRVHQQRLLARLSQRVSDPRVLTLIHRMLKASVVMPDGVKVATEEGVPQGGPLSPLLANVVLSELDEELARRGLRFVRYADDANIYVRSERAGHRVMQSLTRFIERRLRLRVNAAKSAVARPETRHFLGYRLSPRKSGTVEILLSKRSIQRLNAKIRALTPRSVGCSLAASIQRVNTYLNGWWSHFHVCTAGIGQRVQRVDAHIRRRLRAQILKQWKRKRTIARRLIRLGIRPRTAWRRVYEGKTSLWALSHIPVVERALNNAFFAARGLLFLREKFRAHWAAIRAPRQPGLFAVSERS